MRIVRRLAVVAFLAVPTSLFGQWELQQSGTTASLRGLAAVNDRVVWASGTGGTVLRTVDGGSTWRAMIVPGADSLDFRDVEAFDDRRAYVLSIGNGTASRIYRTDDGGETWTLQFTNRDPRAFFDCFTFWNAERGLALSDPVDGRFRLMGTSDGGATWRELPSERLPPSTPGEAAFAASGTCIVARDPESVWIGSGGTDGARVYRSGTGGATWQVTSTPLSRGAPSRGIFAIAFVTRTRGIAVGGDYQSPRDTADNVALTADGGASWRTPTGRPGGYRSGVAYGPASGGALVVAVGMSGSDVSTDGGETWTVVDTLGFNSVAFAPGPTVSGWAVGPRGRVGRWIGTMAPAVPSDLRVRVRKEP